MGISLKCLVLVSIDTSLVKRAYIYTSIIHSAIGATRNATVSIFLYLEGIVRPRSPKDVLSAMRVADGMRPKMAGRIPIWTDTGRNPPGNVLSGARR
jgi:hypothetical protein